MGWLYSQRWPERKDLITHQRLLPTQQCLSVGV